MILSKGLTRLGGVVAIAALMLGLGLASVPAAHAQNVQMTLYGPAESADSQIVVFVDGAECTTASVSASGDGFLWLAYVGGEGGCEASAGSEISFTVDGAAANETVSFESGGSPADAANGITLTVADMGDGDMGDGDGDMGDGDGDMGDGEVMAPDTGNAGFAATSSAGHALALGLGALAVAMLAGARSVTGRSR
ncbi:MAG: hypothetical protein F4151_09935 [Gammaproteobacteria bacterium]|nr:hypothetical protein [Gammaproteobacteria bacterium]